MANLTLLLVIAGSVRAWKTGFSAIFVALILSQREKKKFQFQLVDI